MSGLALLRRLTTSVESPAVELIADSMSHAELPEQRSSLSNGAASERTVPAGPSEAGLSTRCLQSQHSSCDRKSAAGENRLAILEGDFGFRPYRDISRQICCDA